MLIYGAALVAAVANPLTKRWGGFRVSAGPQRLSRFLGLLGLGCRRLEVRDQAGKRSASRALLSVRHVQVESK